MDTDLTAAEVEQLAREVVDYLAFVDVLQAAGRTPIWRSEPGSRRFRVALDVVDSAILDRPRRPPRFTV